MTEQHFSDWALHQHHQHRLQKFQLISIHFVSPQLLCWLMFSAALTHLLFPSQEVKDLCFVCFQNLCVHAMLSCCVLRCAFFLLIFQRGLENDICLQRITRKPTHGQRPPLLLYQPHIWWRKDPKWEISPTLVSGGLTYLVNYFQIVRKKNFLSGRNLFRRLCWTAPLNSKRMCTHKD